MKLHDLRHGAASLMLASGADIGVVSKRLGHSTVTLTVDTYSYLIGGVGRQAAGAAESLVSPVTVQTLPHPGPWNNSAAPLRRGKPLVSACGGR